MTPPTRVLQITNRDSHEVAIDTSFEDGTTWQVVCPPRVLPPGASAEVTITFTPDSETPSPTTLPLDVNALYTIPVPLSGIGVPLLFGLVKPKHEVLPLGSLSEGATICKTLELINRSAIPAVFDAAPSVGTFAARGVTLSPGVPVTVEPRTKLALGLAFRPKARALQWREPLWVHVEGVRTCLSTCVGACVGAELSLGAETLPFGTVVLGSQATKRLQIDNTGDVGC